MFRISHAKENERSFPMKLACNYYRETEELAQSKAIDIDYFKFPALPFQMDILTYENLDRFEDFAARIGKIKPVLFHSLYPAPHNLCSPAFVTDFDAETVDRLLSATKTPGISLHPSSGDVNPAIPEKRLVNTVIGNIGFLREKYRDVDFLSVENLDGLRFGALIKPEIMSEIIEQAECSLLLDISHAYCVSRILGEDFRKYLFRLPLERVCEIHINGWIEKGTDIMSHVKINDTGYRILKELLDYCAPKIVTVEYGRHNDRIGSSCPVLSPDKVNDEAKKEIAEQVSRVRDILF